MANLRYSVKTFRAAGLEARWTKRAGRPVIVARNPQSLDKTWWLVDNRVWQTMQTQGIVQGLEAYTLLGSFFSIGV
jgi:hypothetical protein